MNKIKQMTTNWDNKTVKKVAVIGAGAAGLVAARELIREGHTVKIFEKGSEIGGTWIHNSGLKSINQLNGAITTEVHRVPSAIYDNLRTNLPREIMGFSDFPFHPKTMNGLSLDDRRFPVHQEVLVYLKAFSEFYNLNKFINFDTEVQEVYPINSHHQPLDKIFESQTFKWQVKSLYLGENKDQIIKESIQEEDDFDAVVICNGHYSKPYVAPISGQHVFPGNQMHSYFYRKADEFNDRRVLVLGRGPSGIDIAFEVSACAKCVYMCARTWDPNTDFDIPINQQGNIWRKQAPIELCANGDVQLQDGEILQQIDDIIYCTGYKYDFPFLNSDKINLKWDEQLYIHPLYKHMFPPEYAGTLSFIGLPIRIVPFPMFELQSKWLAQLLAKKCKPLPSKNEMMEEIQKDVVNFRTSGKSFKFFHYMSMEQFQYNRWLSDQCVGVEMPQIWIEEMYRKISEVRQNSVENYRDQEINANCFDDAELEIEKVVLQMKVSKDAPNLQ